MNDKPRCPHCDSHDLTKSGPPQSFRIDPASLRALGKTPPAVEDVRTFQHYSCNRCYQMFSKRIESVKEGQS